MTDDWHDEPEGTEQKRLSPKEYARKLRQEAYQRAKARHKAIVADKKAKAKAERLAHGGKPEKDPVKEALKEKARAMRREAYQREKQKRKDEKARDKAKAAKPEVKPVTSPEDLIEQGILQRASELPSDAAERRERITLVSSNPEERKLGEPSTPSKKGPNKNRLRLVSRDASAED